VLTELGQLLREHRKGQHASLETVAQTARISGPYLLKLERGSVASPSPRVLGRVARALDVPYLRLMELAGYLDETDLARLEARIPRPHPLAHQRLSAEEWRQVGDFIRELLSRRSSPPPE
jgi:transcriptional regulator with XRE-family HTH domain